MKKCIFCAEFSSISKLSSGLLQTRWYQPCLMFRLLVLGSDLFFTPLQIYVLDEKQTLKREICQPCGFSSSGKSY